MMKTLTSTVLIATLASASASAQAPSNIDVVQRFAWGENIGFLNARDADAAQSGVVVEASSLSGYAWAENVGWIDFGHGPANGTSYENVDDTDWGVNLNLTTGLLSGYAWGENIGWVNFDTSEVWLRSDAASFDPVTKALSGYAWAENVGWIALDGVAVVDPTVDLGSSLAGFGGVAPTLTDFGRFAEDEPNTLALINARPMSSAVVLFSLDPMAVPFKGGTVLAVPFVATLHATTNVAGQWVVGLPAVPAPVPPSFVVQAVIADSEAPAGVAISNAIKVIATP